ncbi:MAG TPA: SDR family oxidoreductase [Propioniciclava sp.]|uniref:SDR family NAD(P)-dependent oxidoreductase n=1 Tax=Propioniciclava sp. TaxID=2038686 RepID=UPI002D179CB5|nr:SDR family oxidoreductase [Propioniciclava sp.]HRL50141.1 SDR family oxidoreductase [Propioniciclava sp.]
MSDDVCVITGGGSGIGRATAALMGERGYRIVLAGRTPAKLADTVADLRNDGVAAEAVAGDVSDRDAMLRLAELAANRGRVTAVIHAAGLSPHMGDPATIMAVNALGTLHVNDAFYPVMDSGCVIDTSSMSAYLAPRLLMPTGSYPLSRTDPERFRRRMMGRVRLFPRRVQAGVAYAISKHFVLWCARTDAARFGARGVRVLSITPSTFATPMGEIESGETADYLARNAIKRAGRPEEIAFLYASVADDQMGYLTGTDILCDGGCVAAGGSLVRA